MDGNDYSPGRLVDYFVVVGFNDSSERNGFGSGKVLQRFPVQDWPDTKFYPSLEVFCQPNGWTIKTEQTPPHFFITVLTDLSAGRAYAAVLAFSEPRFPSECPVHLQDDMDDDENEQNKLDINSQRMSPVLYHTKCLVIVSKHPYFEAFRMCLGTIYTIHIEKLEFELETVVGTLIGGVIVPPPGSPMYKFSLGASDRLSVQPPSSATVPCTRSVVAMTFQQLGMYNVVCLFCAVMTERKILFQSQSYTRILEAAQALSAIMYPLKYRHVYVPLLPTALHDFLHSPMPYIMGMHSSHKVFTPELPDVVVADLDTGCLDFTAPIPPLPEPYHSRLLQSLTLVLNKNLFNADLAFPPNGSEPKNTVCPSIDKQIRACFVRLMGELLSEYRLCLQLVRIHPSPVIEFHRSAFLGLRGMQDDEFMTSLVHSNNAFEAFIHERGPPFRVCDLFDEVYATTGKTLKEENGKLASTLENVHVLARQLLMNESSTTQSSFIPKFPQPTDASMANPTPPAFPLLDPIKVQTEIENNVRRVAEQWNGVVSAPAPREVPNAPSSNPQSLLGPNVRRLDVLRSCLRCIFEDKISDARKMLSAVVLSMKSQSVRVAFCQELFKHSKERKSLLEAQQFDLIVRLMNHALQNESENDEHGIAYAMLQLSNTFHRRLSHAVLQFAYTCIQEHAVWLNKKFWEAAFFHDVQTHLKGALTGSSESIKYAPYGRGILKDTWNLYEEPSATKIACQKMRESCHLSPAEIDQAKLEEDEIIKAELGHYAYYMVNMRVPLDATKLRHVNVQNLESSATASIAPSSVDDEMYASDTSSSRSEGESGFAEDSYSGMELGGRDLGMGIKNWIDKIMDVLAEKSRLPELKGREVKQKVPGLVAMQIEQLEHVYKESKRLPPINKPKMLVPVFLPGEQMLQGYLRVCLLPDGRYETNKMIERTQGSCLLPAEGALFLTNYRIIFKGQPCDPFICEQVVVKSIPVMSITRSKQLGQQTLMQTGTEQSSHTFRDALQIRSATFQLLKIAFDEEVNNEKIDTLVNALDELRHPASIGDIFALSGGTASAAVAGQMAHNKEKGKTLKGFAKKTLKNAKMRAGFGQTSLTKKISANASQAHGNQTHSASESDEDSKTLRIEETSTSGSPVRPSLSRTLDRLVDREYCKDYQRLSLCLKTELTLHSGGHAQLSSSPGHQLKLRKASDAGFRLCTANRLYAVCRSYPAVFIVPSKISDESIWKVAKGHKHSRFPVVTWIGDGGALLIRGSAFHAKTMVGRLKKGGMKAAAAGVAAAGMSGSVMSPGVTGSNANLSVLKSSVEQDKYLEALVALSPVQAPASQLRSSVGSLLSLDSLMLTSLDGQSLGGFSQHTPEVTKRSINTTSALGSFMRSSGGKGSRPLIPSHKGGSLRPPPTGQRPNVPSQHSSVSSTLSLMSQTQKKRASTSEQYLQGPQTLTRALLYIFGEKTQSKLVKLDPRCEFIPVEYPTAHDAKGALKKFLRVTAPANISVVESERSHLKLLEESGWLQLVQNILYMSSAVVDIIDIQNSSVAFCIEDGWDATCQLSSMSQILLDPYYRTFDGIRALIEKEWLAFGHRFSHRLNHLAESVHSGMAPIFILFLDAVHQIMIQYPMAFEYNDYFLRLLAYHSTSAYFKTFLLDCEADRVEAGVVQFDARPTKRPELNSQTSQNEDGTLKKSGIVGSFWDFVYERRHKTTMLTNALYLPNSHTVLRPSYALPNLNIWEYYNEDHMSHAASYDFDSAESEMLERASNTSSIKEGALVQSARKVVDLNYDNALFSQHTNLQHLIEEIGGLERDLDQLPRPWTSVLTSCRKQALEGQQPGTVASPSHWYTWLGRALHKKTTVQLLLKGVRTSQTRLSMKPVSGEGVSHNFVKCTFTAPEQCAVCQRMLWGVVVGTGVRCSVCRLGCHEKCAVVAPNTCIQSANNTNAHSPNDHDRLSIQREETFDEGLTDYRPVTETRTHEGYLMKRGVLLKTWKQRWFVLDSIKHQLRYYDTMEDGHCKGFIDLSEVSEVQPVPVPPGVPRKQEGTFFELRTLRRVYNFSAATDVMAKEWIDKIESCLRES